MGKTKYDLPIELNTHIKWDVIEEM